MNTTYKIGKETKVCCPFCNKFMLSYPMDTNLTGGEGLQILHNQTIRLFCDECRYSTPLHINEQKIERYKEVNLNKSCLNYGEIKTLISNGRFNKELVKNGYARAKHFQTE